MPVNGMGRVLVVRRRQIKPALDMVPHNPGREDFGMAQRAQDGRQFEGTVGKSGPFPHRDMPFGRLGGIRQAFPARIPAPYREREYMEDRTKKPQFQDTYQKIEPQDDLFFQEREATRHCHWALHQQVLLQAWQLFSGR